MEITNFRGGLITNPGDHAPRGREFYAQYCRDCRSDKQGWLVPRKGMTQIANDVDAEYIFTHKSVILAVIDDKLRWARIGDIGDPIEFDSFINNPTVLGTLTKFRVVDTEVNRVLVGTGFEPFAVEIGDPPYLPIVFDFYLQKTPKTIVGVVTENANFDDDAERVGLYAQAVSLDANEQRIVVAPLSDKIAEFGITDATADNVNDWTNGTATISRVDTGLIADGVTHVVLYSTRPGNEPDKPTDLIPVLPFQYKPYEAGQRFLFEFSDTYASRESTYISAGDRVNFQYIATNNFRSYVAERESNKIYLSHYDPATDERLYQNYTHTIPLRLGGGFITGLEFIRDNLLVVYASNQIQMIYTDPLAELHQVDDSISPQDSKGNPIGCVAPETIVDMGGEHYFLAANKHVYKFNSRRAMSISDPVQAVFETLRLPISRTGKPTISRAFAFAYDEDYYISIPSTLDGIGIQPNTTLVYEMKYDRWWQDSYGVKSLTKGYPERLYAVIGDQIYELFLGDDDAGTAVRRIWRSNPQLRRAHDKFRSVHVYAMGPATIDVIAKTESGEHRGTIEIVNTRDVWSQKMGCNLRGRNFTVEIQTESTTPIDRITTNEVFRS